jgi:pimeloyl-ACP methyl ester carboxylesterase
MPGIIQMAELKTVVLVHGAFADGSCYAKVIPLLTAKGLKAIAVQNPLSSLADDVKAIKRTLSQQEGPVLLVGHSWGGAVITEAGNDPQVAGLVYVAAGAPNSGESFNDWWKDYTPTPGVAEIKPYGKDGYVAFTQLGVRQYFAHDLPKEEADVVYAVQGPLAARCFDDKISTAAWHTKPSWYIVASEDRTIPPAVQSDSAKRMKATTLTLASSHVPMVSQPDKVADFILKAVTTLNASSHADKTQAAAR